MIDRTIPFYNTILRCDRYQSTESILPKGYSIVSYQEGYENAWAKLECAIGDFETEEEALEYFMATYLKELKNTERILFAVDDQGNVAGSCIAWKDLRQGVEISSLHWLVVDEKYQNQGLGRALCISVLNIFEKEKAFPVYIHTQPWSWKAILLYISLGFALQKNDSFSHYENEYEKAMGVLGGILNCEQLLHVQNCTN